MEPEVGVGTETTGLDDLDIVIDEPQPEQQPPKPDLDSVISVIDSDPRVQAYIAGRYVQAQPQPQSRVVTAPDPLEEVEKELSEAKQKLAEAIQNQDYAAQQQWYDRERDLRERRLEIKTERKAEEKATIASAYVTASNVTEQIIGYYKQNDQLYKHYGKQFEAELRTAARQNPAAFLDQNAIIATAQSYRNSLVAPVLEKALKTGNRPKDPGLGTISATDARASQRGKQTQYDPRTLELYPQLKGVDASKYASDGDWYELPL